MVKRLLVCLAAVAVVVAGAAYVGAEGKATKQTITGEVIEIASYAEKGARGEEFAEAGRFRVENGFPVGILDETGAVYVAIFRDPAPASAIEPANRVLTSLVGKEVVAQGVVHERPGVKVIEILVVAEM